jgi:hypothetical protein
MNDTVSLACGCFIMKNHVEFFCKYHANNQPMVNDPLDRFLNERIKGPDGKDDNSN